MSGFPVVLFCLLHMLFLTKIYLCMETDFCEPVRLDRANVPSHDKLNKELVVYRINAFNQEFYLNLLPDSSFLTPDGTFQYVTTSSSAFFGGDFRRCFYSGDINADRNSYAALSLCGGVRGAFSYNRMEYLIERRSTNTAPGMISEDAEKTHIIRRRHLHAPNSTSRCGVTSSLNQGVVESLGKYKHVKRNTRNLTETLLKSLSRSKRFASIPRYVEVLVVADESMAKFHGDDLKHYLLTLMSVTAKLYKHPSILNAISIVVVKLMVINEAEKGPKVSSNAALTLRNFCTWQKKLNKNNDKHPEYWDTAILFTKQVRNDVLIWANIWANNNFCLKIGYLKHT